MKRNPSQITSQERVVMRRWVQVMIACALLSAVGTVQAGWNDMPMTVKVTNTKAAPRDSKTALVSFDIRWDYSWRQEGNHDAIWVFFKVRPEGSTEWQTVRLVAEPVSSKKSDAASRVRNPKGYGQEKGTPLEFLVPDEDDGPVGMFVRRAEYGYGLTCASNVTAVWNFKANKGIKKDVKVEIRAYGVEMIYIPEGAFYLNTGGVEPFRFYQYTDGSQHTQPYRVTSEGAIQTGQQAGKLWARRGAQPDDNGVIPAAFPKGYGAFYCMKIQIKGGQYCDFLNTLTAEQVAKYCPTGNVPFTSSGTNPVSFTISDEGAIHLYTPVSWGDGIAYAAWAGLRPMSELEYVKVGRGMMEPTTDTGDTIDHPSCWGVEDWTGWRTAPERTVTVANSEGRKFTGTHGQGTLAVPADWPQEDAVGSGVRGGYGPINGHPSTRTEAARTLPARIQYVGWRGVRTAPKEAAE
ncbi:MAG: hypothetical protein WCR06_06980 [bacterium]